MAAKASCYSIGFKLIQLDSTEYILNTFDVQGLHKASLCYVKTFSFVHIELFYKVTNFPQ